MDKSTEWVNKIPVKYNSTTENYKNIEMFENIQTNVEEPEKPNEPIIEGAKFKIFDDFDMHKKRKRFFELKSLGAVIDVFSNIKEFILCPFYKSDQIIDNGIQSVLSVFLAVRCNDLSLNIFPDKEDVEILDLKDLIDPNLLYTEDFTTMKEGFNRGVARSNRGVARGASNATREASKKGGENVKAQTKNVKKTANNFASKFRADCGSKKEKAKQDIKKYSGKIRNEIYNILFIPLVIHILYNLYYMFFFKGRNEFINVEKNYYEPYLKDYLRYILGIAVKPLTWFWYMLDSISKSKTIHSYSDNYPYVFYLILFLIIYSVISRHKKNILVLTRNFLFGKNKVLLFICGFIIAVEYLKALVKETVLEWGETFKAGFISGILQWLIYWIVRLIINIFMASYAMRSVVIYLCSYFYFAIFLSDNKDSFEVYKDIDDSIYDKIYKIYNPDCDQFGLFKYVLQIISKYSFVYLIEITIFLILLNGMKNYRSIDNVNVQSFLYILNFTMIFILGIWCFTKYFTTVKQLDEKYDILNLALRQLAEKNKEAQKEPQST